MNLEERVIAIVVQNIEKKMVVKLESNLRQDLQVDSLNTLMIISALEDEFSIDIDEANFSDITTVADIVTKMRESISENRLERAE